MTRRRLTPAGWCWVVYTAALCSVLVTCSGCATPAPAAPAAPAAGLTCRIAGEPYRLGGELPTAAGWWSVRHMPTNGRAGLWYAPAQQLDGCAP